MTRHFIINRKKTDIMSIEEAMMGGIVFRGKKKRSKRENKVKTKPRKRPISPDNTVLLGQDELKSAANALTDKK